MLSYRLGTVNDLRVILSCCSEICKYLGSTSPTIRHPFAKMGIFLIFDGYIIV